MVEGNGWSEWQNHVLAELQRLNACIDKIETSKVCDHKNIQDHLVSVKDELKDAIASNREEIGKLKVKAGIWGALGGAVPVVIALAWMLIHTLVKGT